MNDSILTSTKKILGIDETYTAFDLDIITHINSALSVLTQLGLGPDVGFMIADAEATWADFLGDDLLKQNAVRTYVYLRVRMVFDPPATSFVINALNEQMREIEWRLSVNRESVAWVDPDPDPDPDINCDPPLPVTIAKPVVEPH